MQFANPHLLWLLLLLIPLLGVFLWYWYWRQKRHAEVGNPLLIAAMTASLSARRRIARGLLILLAIFFFILAAARPQWGETNRPIKRMGADVVIAFDLSRSMLAQDAVPDRLVAAKNEIDSILKGLNGDRVGLVVFTAVSFAQSPLTSDYGAIRFYLDKLDPEQMPVGGTSMGRAITNAVDLFEAHAEEAQTADNRVIVLITDGEDHESDPLIPAKAAADKGIHILTVGIGSEAGTKIPILGKDGRVQGYKRDRSGEYVLTKLDSTTLKEIATATHGEYIHYDGPFSISQPVIDFVNRLEKKEIASLMRNQYEDRFPWFVAPAFLFLLIALGLGDRRPTRRRRFPSLAAFALCSSLISIPLFFSTSCDRTLEKKEDQIATANQLVDEGKFEEALKIYDKVQKEQPTTAELSYNKGRALLGLERWEDAQHAFASALETSDPNLRFNSQFNLGLALAGGEKWEDAYTAFRQAVSFAEANKAIIDEKRQELARSNLEIVFRKLYPPCKALEDDSEEDDSPETAKPAKDSKLTDRTLCGLDDDWVRIPALTGSSIRANVTYTDLRENPDAEQIFTKEPGDIVLSLYGPDGKTLLTTDAGSLRTTSNQDRRATRSIDAVLPLKEGEQEGEATEVFLRLHAAEHLEFKVNGTIEAIPPCSALQEDSEPNNTRSSAKAPPTPQSENQSENQPPHAHLCPTDVDWFKVDVEMGDSLFFDIQPGKDAERGTAPQIKAELVDRNGRTIAEAFQDGPYLTVGKEMFMAPQTVYLKVSGVTENEQGPYSLETYHFPPCPAGNDRMEPNNNPNQAATLDPSKQAFRYLRLCETDTDFFQLTFPEPEKDAAKAPNDAAANGSPAKGAAAKPKTHRLAMGLSRAGISRAKAAVHPGGDAKAGEALPAKTPSPFTFDRISLNGELVITAGTPPAIPPSTHPAPVGNDPQNDTQSPPAIDLLLMEPAVDAPSVLLRVTGPPSFYHLLQLNPQSPQQQQQQQQDQQKQEQQDQKDQQKDQQDQKEQDQKEGSDQDKEEQDKKEQQNQEDKGKQEEQKEGQKEEQKAGEPEPKPEDAQQAEQKKGTRDQEEDTKERNLEAILRALERSDDNLQMKKSIQNQTERYIDKDW